MAKKHRNRKFPKTLSGCMYVYFDLVKQLIKTDSANVKEKLQSLIKTIDDLYQKQFYP